MNIKYLDPWLGVMQYPNIMLRIVFSLRFRFRASGLQRFEGFRLPTVSRVKLLV